MPQEPMPNGYRGGAPASPRPATAPAAAQPAPQAAPRSIFRAEAVQRYRERQDRVVLPDLIAPRVFAILWILAVILLALGSIIVFWPFLVAL